MGVWSVNHALLLAFPAQSLRRIVHIAFTAIIYTTIHALVTAPHSHPPLPIIRNLPLLNANHVLFPVKNVHHKHGV